MTTVEALPPERPIHGQMVLLPTPPPGGFTAADLTRLIEVVDARFELLDGEVLMMAPATHWHDEVIDILKHALRRIAPQALVVATEKGIDLGRTVPEPDVLVVSRAVVTSGSLVFQPSDVHLAIEVVSPGTTTKDRTLRPAQYASASIKCFWRVENEDDAMVVYTFELLPEGGYAPTGVFRGRVKVDRPFPIDIDLPEVTWLSLRGRAYGAVTSPEPGPALDLTWRMTGTCSLGCQAIAVGVGDRLGAIPRADLSEQVVYMALHGVLADEQRPCDHRVGQPRGDEPENLGLTGRELVRRQAPLGCGLAGGAIPAGRQQPGAGDRVQDGVPGGSGAQRADDVIAARVLGEIAERSRPQRLDDRFDGRRRPIHPRSASGPPARRGAGDSGPESGRGTPRGRGPARSCREPAWCDLACPSPSACPISGLGLSCRISWLIPGHAGTKGRPVRDIAERVDAEYARISLDKRGAAEGVETQQAENADAADELGLVIARSYVDNDLSAYSGVERPEYERLLADIAAGKVGTLVIWHANRLHRSTEEVNAFIKLARAHKVRLYSTTKGAFYNLEKASGRKELRDDTSEAEYESEHRGERVAIARKRQARQGAYGGGVRPFGWGVDTGRVRSVCVNPKAPPMDRVYEDRLVLDMTRHNEGEAGEIRRWADDLLSGVSMNQVLRDLAARGVPTVAMADERTVRRNGKTAAHAGWGSRTIQQILTSPRTSGHVVYQGKIVTRNAYQPILPEDVRQALITLFSDPARKTSPGNTPRWLGSLIYRCGTCKDGTTMTVRRNKSGTPVYRCRAKGHCQWPAGRVDAHVESVVIERLSRPDVTGLLPRETGADVAALREELIVTEARKKGAAQMYARGTIDAEQLETITAETDQATGKIRAELSAATAKSPLADFAATEDARRTWEDLTLGRKREVLRHLITVTLPPLGRGHVFTRDLIQVGPPSSGRAA